MTDPVVLGVDGGNTKTDVVVSTWRGEVLARARGGCTDIYGAPSVKEALIELERTVREALGAAGVAGHRVASAVYCLAGADYAEDFELLRSAIGDMELGSCFEVYNDGFAALRAGSASFTGVAAVCGTGGITVARAGDGRMWQSSFWQETQGGRQLGSIAFAAVVREELGMEEPSALRGRALQLYSADSVEELLHRWTRRGASRPSLEPLGRALLEEAASGDTVAASLVHRHGRELGRYAAAAAGKVGLQGDFPLVLGGTVLLRSALMREALIHEVRSHYPVATPARLTADPVLGAVLLALDCHPGGSHPDVTDRLLAALKI